MSYYFNFINKYFFTIEQLDLSVNANTVLDILDTGINPTDKES